MHPGNLSRPSVRFGPVSRWIPLRRLRRDFPHPEFQIGQCNGSRTWWLRVLVFHSPAVRSCLGGAAASKTRGSHSSGNFAGTTTNLFRISAGGSPYVLVDLSGILSPTTECVGHGHSERNSDGIRIPRRDGQLSQPIWEPADACEYEGTLANPDVFVRPAAPQGPLRDLAVPLMLGTEQGGLEVSGFAEPSTRAERHHFGGTEPI